MTVIATIALCVIMVIRLHKIYALRANDFESLSYTYQEDEMSNLDISLGRFNDSLNFIFGLTTLPEDGSFDIQNNPYVEFLGLEVTDGDAHMV